MRNEKQIPSLPILNMLPDNHGIRRPPYYNRNCRVCKETIQQHDEYTECERCAKLMCEDCHVKAQFSCQVCAEKLEKGDDYDFYNVCRACLSTCPTCDLRFHPQCKTSHRRTACSPLGRAQREFALATKRVQQAKFDLVKAKQELHDARIARAELEKRLLQLQRSAA